MRPNTARHFWANLLILSTDACWEWRLSVRGKRYGQFRFQGRYWSVHRLAWFLTHGTIPAGMDVLHKCDNPICCNPLHLFLGTQLDNMRDMVAKGRKGRPAVEKYARGETHGAARLTKADVLEIRANPEGLTQCQRAERYRVNQGTISDILRFKTWRHV